MEAGTGLIDTTTAITWSWILWNFITAQGAAEQLKEQLHGYFGSFGTFTLSGVTAAWDISNNRELKVAGPWISFHGIATPTPQPSRKILEEACVADLSSVLFRRPAATVVEISAARLD